MSPRKLIIVSVITLAALAVLIVSCVSALSTGGGRPDSEGGGSPVVETPAPAQGASERLRELGALVRELET